MVSSLESVYWKAFLNAWVISPMINEKRKLTLLAVALNLSSSLTCFAASAPDSMSKAKSEYGADEYKRAAKDCTEWIDKHPADTEALRLRGKCYLADGDFSRAFKDLESIPINAGPLELAMANQNSINVNDNDSLDFPKWLEALVILYAARLSAQEGQLDKALKLCDCALMSSPNFPECLSLRGTILSKQFRFYEAEEYFRQAVSLRPADWHMWMGYSAVLEQQQKPAQALEAIEKALQLVKTPPYPEPNIDTRIASMTKQRDYLLNRKNK